MTHLINHTFIHTDFGIAISPDHSGKVRRWGGESVFVLVASVRIPFKALLCAEFRWCSQVMFQKPVGFDCFGRGTSAWPLTRSTFHLSPSFRCCTTPETATSFWRSASWYLLFSFRPDLIYCSFINHLNNDFSYWLFLFPLVGPLVVWRLWRHLEEDSWQCLSGQMVRNFFLVEIKFVLVCLMELKNKLCTATILFGWIRINVLVIWIFIEHWL